MPSLNVSRLRNRDPAPIDSDASPQAPSGVSRERALAILGQLVRVLRELRRR
jgi:hypothetical protein